MIISILAFFCGVLSFQCLPVLPSTSQIVLIGILEVFIVIGVVWVAKKHYKKVHFCLLLFVIFLLGFLYAVLSAKLVGNWELSQSLEGKSVIVTGYVSSLPTNKIEYTKFRFTTESIAGEQQKVNLLLSWYDKDRSHLAAGEKWQLLVKLKRPHGMLNPGGFDYEKYLWQQHIRATGYIVKGVANKKIFLLPADIPVRYRILVWRQKVEDKINLCLAQHSLLNMINALVLGDQSGITKDQWIIFRDTGTSYLMAIAGLHICLAAGVVFMLVQFLWCRISWLTLWMPAKKAAVLFGLIAAIFYSVISGFSIPTQRALVMLLMFTQAALLQRNINLWNVLCAALLVVLLLDPMSVLSMGFWLSFFAVVLIFYVTSGRLQLSTAHWRKYLRMQGTMTLGLAPFTMLFFSQVSLTTFVANIFALPGVCLVVVPLSLFGGFLLLFSTRLAQYVLLLAEKIMELVWHGLQWIALYPQFNWQHCVSTWWQFVLAVIGVFLLLAPRGFFGKLAGIVWCCPLLFYAPPKPSYGEFWFNLLDVGQGLATVIQTQHHAIVYDTGPKFAESDVGESIIIPFLQVSGISHIDVLIVSHGDSDHSGGADSILHLIPVDRVITSVPEKFPTAIAQKCWAGQEWHWDGVNFHILYPPLGLPYGGNKSSCVLRIDNGQNSILLPGDIEHNQEKLLLQQARVLIPSSVLVAAHHGSSTSSSPDFVNAVDAKYVLFSSGYENRFHFPAEAVLNRYQQQGAKILQTVNSGAISFKLSFITDTLMPELYREVVRHYWRAK